MIKLKNVNYIYSAKTNEEKKALDDINLNIGKGEIISIVGQTGSGKSTLIKLLNGLNKPSSGEILFEGKNIFDKDFSLMNLRQKVGLVFQYPENQLFATTVVEDVQFGPKNMGLSPLDVELFSYKALKDVGVPEEIYDVSPLILSGGQKRRVAMAGVLAMQPDILVLDEPMAGLDPKGREEIFSLLMNIHRERNITIIFVSHSMEDVARYSKRMIVMHQGKILLDGEPKKIFCYEKELKQIGLDVPIATRIIHKIREKGIVDIDECITYEEVVKELAKKLSEGD